MIELILISLKIYSWFTPEIHFGGGYQDERLRFCGDQSDVSAVAVGTGPRGNAVAPPWTVARRPRRSAAAPALGGSAAAAHAA